ncbi:MAG TPA: hypothetical protein VEW91_06420 [bacterium]|nr:hypothetical protein [bacterium]
MFGLQHPRRALRRAIAKRLVLGFLMALFAIVAGWMLVPPDMGVDKATVEWYTR